MGKRVAALALVALAGFAALAEAGQEKRYANTYLGKSPPEIASEKGDWLNAEGPLTLEKLKGRPVWIEFSFIN